MKKTLLILSHALELGGVERSLIGLLDAIDYSIWDVDLFLLRHEGELMDAIPSHVNLLEKKDSYTVLARPMKDTLREGHILLTAARLLGKISASIYAKRHKHIDSAVGLDYSHKYTCPLMPKIQPTKEYDLAISFLTPHYFVARKVRAKKKVAWIHTDYSNIQLDVLSEKAIWSEYDQIASVSEAVTDSFLKIFPFLKEKIILFENILPKTIVENQADEFDVREEIHSEGVRILSIGRFCYQKNFDNVPEICARLVREGINVHWYLIGYGPDEDLICKKIKEAGMEDRVIILGKKKNPYPYIKACDVYIQPSRYEGKAVTVREAQMLCKLVVITEYDTAASQLEDGVDGVIVPIDNEDCAKKIAELLYDSNRRKFIEDNCRIRDYTNISEIEKLNKIAEN